MRKPRHNWPSEKTIFSKEVIEEERGQLPPAFQLLVNFSNFAKLAESCPHRKIEDHGKSVCAYKDSPSGCCAFDSCPKIKLSATLPTTMTEG